MSGITPSLWFDGKAEEAARYYVEVFGGEIGDILRATESVPGATPGDVVTIDFRIRDQAFNAINGGPEFNFTEAVSFIVECESQDEVDRLWEELTREGAPGPCGWLKDRYGVSWQIVPRALIEYLASHDRALAERVMREMLTMQKIDIARLDAAAAG